MVKRLEAGGMRSQTCEIELVVILRRLSAVRLVGVGRVDDCIRLNQCGRMLQRKFVRGDPKR
jgi:hypothetical protein